MRAVTHPWTTLTYRLITPCYATRPTIAQQPAENDDNLLLSLDNRREGNSLCISVAAIKPSSSIDSSYARSSPSIHVAFITSNYYRALESSPIDYFRWNSKMKRVPRSLSRSIDRGGREGKNNRFAFLASWTNDISVIENNISRLSNLALQIV